MSATTAARTSPVPTEESLPTRGASAKGAPVVPLPVGDVKISLSLEDHELLRKWEALQLTAKPLALEDIRFLISSNLAFWIETFKNSTRRGADNHSPRMINSEYCFKMEGRWVPISEIRSKISYDPQSEKLVTTGNTGEVWSYISPDGLVKRDRLAYDKLVPIEQMDPETYTKLLGEANQFWKTNPEVDAGVEKKCILQVVTTNRMHHSHWALENLARAYPEHATYRVIMPDGKVFSFGFQMEKAEMDQMFNDKQYPFPLTFTKTTDSKISTPDYEESRPFHKKRITSLTMTAARAENILKFIADQNKGTGVRFNYIRQNCSTLGREILKAAGTTGPVRWRLGYGLSTLLPEWEKIPYVGEPIAMVMHTVKSIADKFFTALWKVTPKAVQEVVCFIPRKVSTLLSNSLVYLLGGTLASSNIRPERDTEDELDNRDHISCFSRLIRKASDWFRDDLSDVEPHLSLIDWQMNQQSTRVLDYENQTKLYF